MIPLLTYIKRLKPNESTEPLTYIGHHVIDGNTVGAAVDPFGGALYNKSCIYAGGRTFFTFKRNQNSSDGRPVVGMYFNGSVSYHVLTDTYADNLDYHNHPTLAVHPDGHLWLFHEQHGNSPLIYRSNSAFSINAWTKMKDVTTVKMDYPKTIIRSDGTFMQWARGGGFVFRSSSDGVTWTTPITVTQSVAEPGATDSRHYPFMPVNSPVDGKYHFVIYKRIIISSVTRYIRAWHFYTENGTTYFNSDGSFSKNVQTSGLMTETELNDNCLAWYDPDYTVGLNPFMYNGRPYINKIPDLPFFNGTSWDVIEDISLPVQGAFQIGNRFYNIVEDGSDYKLKYTTNFVNLFDTGVTVFKPDTIGYTGCIPQNIAEIPSGEKFVVLHVTRKAGDIDRVSSNRHNDVIAYEFLKG